MRWEMAITADADVVHGTPADRKLAAVKALCRDRQAETGDGWTDADTLWPSELLQIIDAEDES